jgi:hypothetical protein
MFLFGHEIKRQLGENIIIDPFGESRLNPIGKFRTDWPRVLGSHRCPR